MAIFEANLIARLDYALCLFNKAAYNAWNANGYVKAMIYAEHQGFDYNLVYFYRRQFV